MSYSIETYDKAQSILDRRKERATLEAQDRADELCAKIPELNTINRKLAQIGLNISKTFFASQNPKEDIDRLRTESLALQEEKKNLLKKNGYGENALAIKYTCPACERWVLPSPVPPIKNKFFEFLLKLVAYLMQFSLIFSALLLGDISPFSALSG